MFRYTSRCRREAYIRNPTYLRRRDCVGIQVGTQSERRLHITFRRRLHTSSQFDLECSDDVPTLYVLSVPTTSRRRTHTMYIPCPDAVATTNVPTCPDDVDTKCPDYVPTPSLQYCSDNVPTPLSQLMYLYIPTPLTPNVPTTSRCRLNNTVSITSRRRLPTFL